MSPKAKLSVRIDADLKRRLKTRLAERGETLEAWVESAVRACLEADKLAAECERPANDDKTSP